jgi:hypothetical protein
LDCWETVEQVRRNRTRVETGLFLSITHETVSPEQRGLSLKGLKGYYLSPMISTNLGTCPALHIGGGDESSITR